MKSKEKGVKEKVIVKELHTSGGQEKTRVRRQRHN